MDSVNLLIFGLVAGPIILFILMQLTTDKSSRVNKLTVRRQWGRVIDLSKGSEPQFAIIEADKVFDNVLKQLGFSGDTMADRLKSAQPSISSVDSVWSAHKLRNKLVHEPDFKLSKIQVKSALAHFEKSLKRLKVL